MRALVWFRSDLRVADNTALHEACRAADRGVVAVFVVTPRQWREHDWGPPKVDFVLRCLSALSEELEERRIPLLIRETPRFSGVPKLLTGLAREHECDALCFNEEYEVNEAGRDRKVRVAFEERDLQVRAFHDQTVLPPDLVRTGSGDFYRVFTPFKRAWIGEVLQRGIPEPRRRPRRLATPVTSLDEVPRSLPGFEPPSGLADLWPAGERAAQKRLDRFIRRGIGDYKKDRDFPGIEGTSRISPYLAAGAISPRQCLAAGAAANMGELDSGERGPVTWISELVWREFYRHILVGYPRVCRNRAFKPETERIVWDDDDARFRAWAEGRTGVPIVDAAMRQLAETGWMHNRLRMIAAMYLTKDLFLDWRRGEAWFMRHLVDGDFASNNGGWQWSASTGCDAAPYFRIFNPVRQSERWDPDGEFIRSHVPELAGLEAPGIHDPSALPPLERAGLDYPEPLVDHRDAVARAVEEFRRLKD